MKRVMDIMTPDVLSVRPNDLIGDVRDIFLDTGFHCLPVLGDDEHAVGVVSSWDLIEEYQPEEAISNAMTDRVHKIGPSASVGEAAAAMREHCVHHLVVVDEMEALIGILSSFDLLEPLATGEQ